VQPVLEQIVRCAARHEADAGFLAHAAADEDERHIEAALQDGIEGALGAVGGKYQVGEDDVETGVEMRHEVGLGLHDGDVRRIPRAPQLSLEQQRVVGVAFEHENVQGDHPSGGEYVIFRNGTAL
jgi:hypothetical protein